jgi:hypothetical protein
MDIINDFVPKDIIVKLKFPNQRAYEFAWSLALLRGYENFDDFVRDIVLNRLEMFPEGRDDLDNVHWGFKSRDQREKERAKVSR